MPDPTAIPRLFSSLSPAASPAARLPSQNCSRHWASGAGPTIARDVVGGDARSRSKLVRDFGSDILDGTADWIDRGCAIEYFPTLLSAGSWRRSCTRRSRELRRRSALVAGAIRFMSSRCCESTQRGITTGAAGGLHGGGSEPPIDRSRQASIEHQRYSAAQASREQRLSVADDVIVNTGTVEDLPKFVGMLHRNYSLLATSAGT